MTTKRDLKRRVRDRQTRTGESYVTARRHVAAAAEPTTPAVPVVEMLDLSAEAAAIGLRCRIHMDPTLAVRLDRVAVLTRLRDVLIATDSDPATGLFRAVGLRGERVHAGRATMSSLEEARRFRARARAGLGGVSERGSMLALHVGAELVVCSIWLTPAPPLPSRESAIVITAAATPADAFELWRVL